MSVDAADPAQVAPVVARTVALMGTGGLADLLARLPGTRTVPGTPGRLFKPAVPPTAWIGPEDQLVLTDPVVHQHVVGGVVLARTTLSPADLGPTVARLVTAAARAEASYDEASAVLTATADALARL